MRISAEGVDFSFGNVKVLEDVGIVAEKGSFIGVIGPNGSGKTTLLRILSKVLKPSGGVIHLNGNKLSELSQRKVARDLAVVPQDTSVNFDFTAYEVVLMGRTPHKGRLERESQKDLDMTSDAMVKTETYSLRNRLITTLSGGERQKVIIAKALAQQPKVLLLDEPTANLDIRNQIEIMDLIGQAVKEKDITAVMAIHDINLAARYCDEILMLKTGRIYAAGSPASVLTSENLEAVFGIASVVKKNAADGSIHIIPTSPVKNG